MCIVSLWLRVISDDNDCDDYNCRLWLRFWRKVLCLISMESSLTISFWNLKLSTIVYAFTYAGMEIFYYVKFKRNRHPSLLRIYQKLENPNNHKSESQNLREQKYGGEKFVIRIPKSRSLRAVPNVCSQHANSYLPPEF